MIQKRIMIINILIKSNIQGDLSVIGKTFFRSESTNGIVKITKSTPTIKDSFASEKIEFIVFLCFVNKVFTIWSSVVLGSFLSTGRSDIKS